jgi:hypothetical protein
LKWLIGRISVLNDSIGTTLKSATEERNRSKAQKNASHSTPSSVGKSPNKSTTIRTPRTAAMLNPAFRKSADLEEFVKEDLTEKSKFETMKREARKRADSIRNSGTFTLPAHLAEKVDEKHRDARIEMASPKGLAPSTPIDPALLSSSPSLPTFSIPSPPPPPVSPTKHRGGAPPTGSTNGRLVRRTKVFANGDKYVGTFNNMGQVHGQGTYEFANGDIYEGEFNNGKYEGRQVFGVESVSHCFM